MHASVETVFASAARTATVNSPDFLNPSARGVVVVIDCTSITDSPSVVFTVQGKCPVSAKYFTIIASAAITATGTTVLRVYPGLTAAANTVVSDVLPKHWRVIATHDDSDSATYSVSAQLIP